MPRRPRARLASGATLPRSGDPVPMTTVRRTDAVIPTHPDEPGGRPGVLVPGGMVPAEAEAGAR
jgi:hypothetical protein